MSYAGPLVTACYIVKDEEDVIEASLQAIRPFVDEILVYDTGSSDDTPDIVRRLGVKLVEGYWDDDFGAARNRALAHCRTPWIVSVDADEQAAGDPDAFRQFLRLTTTDLVLVVQASQELAGGHGNYQTPASRIFRRSRYRWHGALHEQLQRREGSARRGKTDTLILNHVGYTPVRWQERDKSGRNVAVAMTALAQLERNGTTDLAKPLMDAARSHAAAGHNDEALALFKRIDPASADASVIAGSAQSAFNCALAEERYEEAEEWLDALEGLRLCPSMCCYMRGQLALAQSDLESADRWFDLVTDGTDVYGVPFLRASIAGDLATLRLRQDRRADAVAVLLPALARGHVAPPLMYLLALCREVPGSLDELARVLPQTLELEFSAQAQVIDPRDADDFLEAMHRAGRSSLTTLVGSATVAKSLTPERALVWSLRLREAGFASRCPLAAIVDDERRTVEDRVVAGALLIETGADEFIARLEPLLLQVERVDSLMAQLQILTPAFAARLVPA